MLNLPQVFSALSHETRWQILRQLSIAPDGLNVQYLTGLYAQSQNTLSHHLKELATAGLIDRHQAGKYAIYKINRAVISAMVNRIGNDLGMGNIVVSA